MVHNRTEKHEIDITNKELNNKRLRHDNKCDICGKTETANTNPKYNNIPNKLSVDHHHESRRFRGFLCLQCNRNMGWFDKYKNSIHSHYRMDNANK